MEKIGEINEIDKLDEADRSDEADECERLAHAIVCQAVRDWRKMVSKGAVEKLKTPYGTLFYAELREFFKSQWCAYLCGNIDPLFILSQLEKERKAVIKDN